MSGKGDTPRPCDQKKYDAEYERIFGEHRLEDDGAPVRDHQEGDEVDDKKPGCCYPGKCCMPDEDYRFECHTAEMLEQQHGEQEGMV